MHIPVLVKNLQNPLVRRQMKNLPGKAIDVDAERQDEDQLHDEDEEHGEDGGDDEAGGGRGEGLEGVEGDGRGEQLGVGLAGVHRNYGHHHNHRDDRRHPQDGCKPCQAPSENKRSENLLAGW